VAGAQVRLPEPVGHLEYLGERRHAVTLDELDVPVGLRVDVDRHVVAAHRDGPDDRLSAGAARLGVHAATPVPQIPASSARRRHAVGSGQTHIPSMPMWMRVRSVRAV
jgi:hypothetical protein